MKCKRSLYTVCALFVSVQCVIAPSVHGGNGHSDTVPVAVGATLSLGVSRGIATVLLSLGGGAGAGLVYAIRKVIERPAVTERNLEKYQNALLGISHELARISPGAMAREIEKEIDRGVQPLLMRVQEASGRLEQCTMILARGLPAEKSLPEYIMDLRSEHKREIEERDARIVMLQKGHCTEMERLNVKYMTLLEALAQQFGDFVARTDTVIGDMRVQFGLVTELVRQQTSDLAKVKEELVAAETGFTKGVAVMDGISHHLHALKQAVDTAQATAQAALTLAQPRLLRQPES